MTQTTFINGVLGLAINSNHEFLLTQRNHASRPDIHLKWQIPGGGMEYGEIPEQTLARELEEELQVTARILFPYPLIKISTWDKFEDKPTKLHVTLLTYLIDIGDQIPRVEQDPETQAWKWFGLEEALKLDLLPEVDAFLLEATQLLNQHQLLENK